eukprot:7855151-Pyramimonas_sp.AAC.1
MAVVARYNGRLLAKKEWGRLSHRFSCYALSSLESCSRTSRQSLDPGNPPVLGCRGGGQQCFEGS